MTGSSEVLWMGGHWRESYYTSIFQLRPDKPLEMHYHDNDEYWFIFRGHITATYNGASCELAPGDMLATGMGYEHGAPAPTEVVEGVGFTPFLDGQKRFGHLHRDEHGDPVPGRSLE
jgi:mannose-6-phosphate isomerase-like protein (cupin superfamily)